MRIMIVGASGLIGSAATSHLAANGHSVLAIVRRLNHISRRLPAEVVTLDLTGAVTPTTWAPLLAGVDAVIYCAGVIQGEPGGSAGAVHSDAPGALFQACEAAKVRRIIHLSAVGVERSVLSNFSSSKIEGDRRLQAADLDWVVLRPSVVLGEAAYGGSALFRGLAALPVLPLIDKAGQIQPVQLQDLLSTIDFFLQPDAPARITLEIVGPEKLTVAEIVSAYRQWLGFRPARTVEAPTWSIDILRLAGDSLGWLGWRPPIRTNAIRELERGATGDPARWTEMTGIRPRSFRAALAARPASVQDNWFARLYFLKPLVFLIFGLFWIATGLVSLGPGWTRGVNLLDGSFLAPIAAPVVIAGALLDMLLGILIAWRRTTRWGLYGTLAISLFYAGTGTIVRPELWSDPLGPMLKIWPVMVLNLVALAILDDR